MSSRRIIRVKPAPVRQAIAEKKTANAPRYAPFDVVTILEEVVVRNRPPQVFTVLVVMDTDECALDEGRDANPTYRLRSLIDGHEGVIRQNIMSPVSQQYLVHCMSFYMGVHAKIEEVYERMQGSEEDDGWCVADEEEEDDEPAFTEHVDNDGIAVRTYGGTPLRPYDEGVEQDDEIDYYPQRPCQGTTRGGI